MDVVEPDACVIDYVNIKNAHHQTDNESETSNGQVSAAEATRSIKVPRGVNGTPSARRIRIVSLVASDLTALTFAALGSALAYEVMLSVGEPRVPLHAIGAINSVNAVAMFLIPFAVIICGSYADGHYTRFRPFWTEIFDFLSTAAQGIALGAFVLFVADVHFSRLWFSGFWALALLAVPWGRHATRQALLRRDYWYRPVLMVGTGANAQSARAAIEHDPGLGQCVVGFIAIEPNDQRGALDDLDQTIHDLEGQYGQLDVLYAPESDREHETFGTMLDGPLARARTVLLSPPGRGLPLYGAGSTTVLTHDTILLSLNANLGIRWKQFVKRTCDLIGASVLLLVLAPLILVIAGALAIEGGKVFYISRRIGRNGEAFGCLKFRSMMPDADEALANHLAQNQAAAREYASHFKLQNDPRTTPLGQLLRRTSLDELPQLLNVLRGDMSLVGPRPILPAERRSYGPGLALYEITRPGLTGLWQVHGRSALSQRERARLNVWYTRNWSLRLDIVILAKTIPVILRGSGAT